MARVSAFLEQYKKDSTRMGYASAVYAFFDFKFNYSRQNKRVSDIDREKYEEFADEYFSSSPNFVQDLIDFMGTFADRPPKTAQAYLASIKELFIFNDVNFSDKDKKRLKNKTPRGGSATVERDLDLDLIRTIMQHADLKTRTLILVLVSSGLRLNEALSLNIGDVDLSNGLGAITVRGERTKTRQQRITFCTPEAVESIKEWLKVRPAYIESARNKANGINKNRIKNDERIFPFSDSNLTQMWSNLLKKAELSERDQATNRLDIHPHMFRKFFSSQLRVVVPPDIVEVLMGHRVGGVIGTYRSYTRKELQSHYEKGMHLLTVTMPKEIREIESEFKEKLAGHSEILEKLVRENIELKDKIERLEKQADITETLLKELLKAPDIKEIAHSILSTK